MSEFEEHPIKRVRKAFKDLPKISGIRFSGAKQFARWIGCSESLIRNVETGSMDFSEKLARMIEAKTGVSAEWLLSEPGPNDQIRDIDGNEWSPKRINVFSAYPDILLLYKICPSLLPRVIAKLVEAELMEDFFNGKPGRSVGILQGLFRKKAFRRDSSFGEYLYKAVKDDEAFHEKYKICLDRIFDDSPGESSSREKCLLLLKDFEPDPPPGSQIAKVAN